MNDHRRFPSAAAQLALGGNLATVYYLATFTEVPPGPLFPQILLLYAPLVYLLNRLFLRHPRSMRALAIFNTLPVLGLLGLYLAFEPRQNMAYPLFTAGFLIWITFRGCQFALNGPALRNILLGLDCGFLLLIFYSCYACAMPVEPIRGVYAAAAFLASILAASSCRSSRPLTARSWLVIGTACVLLFGVMALFLAVAADPAGQLIVTLWSALTSAVGTAGRGLLGILTFLLSLFPSGDYSDNQELEMPEIPQFDTEAVAEVSPVGGAVLVGILAVCAVIFLLKTLRRMGRIQLTTRTRAVSVTPSRRERTSFLSGLRRLITAWMGAFSLHLLLWHRRNTPKGLYFLLVHRCRLAPWRKRSQETPREFLLRLQQAAAADAELASALGLLADAADAAFYAPGCAPDTLPYAPMVRRRMGAAARRQFLRDIIAKLHPSDAV